MYKRQALNKDTYIICNGYKRTLYKQYITELINENFNVIPVLDHVDEFDYYKKHVKVDKCQLGIRISTEEEPSFAFYSSRLGIRYTDIISLYKEKIQSLSLIHI